MTQRMPISHALILTPVHNVLLLQAKAQGSWTLPTVECVQKGPRPLLEHSAFFKTLLGFEAPAPIGSRPLVMSVRQTNARSEENAGTPVNSCHRDFSFLITDGDPVPDAEGLTANARSTGKLNDARFVPLREFGTLFMASEHADLWWELYCETLLGGYEPKSRLLDVFQFGGTPEQAARLAHLVLKGKKRWTSASLVAQDLQGLVVPSVGLLSIVTDGFGIPLCLIETMETRHVAFQDVTPDVASGEGEGDLSYEDWRDGHVAYFSREAQELGLEFAANTMVFNERFEVRKIFGQEG